MRLKLKWIFTLMMAFLVQLSFAQEKAVSGTVVEDGLPLPGVSVVVKGTTRGTQTDFDGNYTINAKTGETLVYSFIGMDAQSKVVGASNVINVTMASSDNELEEVVVLAYGQVKKKSEVTGNVVKVSGETIANTPLVSADQALQGRVAGLQMSTTSGSPGATQDIRIRGISGYGTSSDPLIVIDGVPIINQDMGGSSGSSSLSALSSINSSDIESMTVLKDATATSVYGARGAAGVILITTKKGKAGLTKYSLTTTAGIQNKAVSGLKMAGGAQKEELYLETLYNDFGSSLGFSKDQTYDYFSNNTAALPTGNIANSFDRLQEWKNAGSQEYNWQDKVENKNALMYNLDFSANGGDDKSNFYASLGYNKTESIAFGGDFRRVTGTFNYDRNLSDKLKLTTSFKVANTKQNAIMENGSYFSNPMLTKYFMNPWLSPYNTDGSYNTNLGGLHNTLYTISNNKEINDLTRMLGNFGVNYQIIKGLSFTTSIGLDFNFSDYSAYKNPVHGDGVAYNGYAENQVAKNFNYVWQNGFDYAFGFGKHKFNTKVLMEYQKNKYSSLYGFGESVPQGFDMLGNAAANWDASSDYNDWANLSYLGIVNYNFDGKYLLDASIRRESSSKFSAENRWGTFWSVGGAWNITGESFMQNVEWINLLRARASYGTTGNSNISLNKFQALLGTGNYNGSSVYALSQLPTNIGWETQKKFDAGVDFGIFDNRVNGSVAFYNSLSSDLLFSLNIPMSSSESQMIINSGSMRNRGMEYELSVDIIRGENVNWSVSGNFATVNNKMISVANDFNGDPLISTTSTQRVEAGHALNSWYMRKYAGVDTQTGDALWYINGKDGATTNQYGDAEVAYQGDSALPKYTGGLSTHVDFYNFFVDGTFYYSGGNKVYQDWATYTNATGVRALTYNYGEAALDRWQQPGDVTDVPRLTTNSTNNELASTRFLHDGDFIRLRDVAFGYNFKKEMLKNTGFDGISLSVRGTNLWTWKKDSSLEYDPETRADGYTNLANPPIKSVTLTANLKF